MTHKIDRGRGEDRLGISESQVRRCPPPEQGQHLSVEKELIVMMRKSRARHGRTQTQTKTLAIGKQRGPETETSPLEVGGLTYGASAAVP